MHWDFALIFLLLAVVLPLMGRARMRKLLAMPQVRSLESLAITAALCEEFLYRGFGMAALTRRVWPSVCVILATSLLFGLAHVYQGRGGFITPTVLGTVFAIERIAYDSPAPVTVSHSSVDVPAGLAGPPFLMRKDGASE